MELLLSVLTDALFISLLVWCSYTDIKKRTVSNLWVILLLCLRLIHMAFLLLNGNNTWWAYPAGLLLSVPFIIAWRRNGMGAGDVKLIMAIGLYLGLLNTLIAFAFMLIPFAGIMIRSWIRNKTLKCRIPFAPFLAFGVTCEILMGYLHSMVMG